MKNKNREERKNFRFMKIDKLILIQENKIHTNTDEYKRYVSPHSDGKGLIIILPHLMNKKENRILLSVYIALRKLE